ncbi:tetratricopeptide repeat protein [Kibdelosporangium aridum]|uniref:Tetratrico peptide repeat-containing protein n=1 Tax=Kibdelosporangium aridum TaxID=2030 RepID=A0A1Y5XQG3_KIBAR|nr:tetratricopeptide repeat protein [Kibdelosporangium aridum]SMD11607.1 Tetratrico peptide repeat-containing protein [Kibdelosporangium aridum]
MTSDPVGLFELASANDSTGRPELAEPLYRKALESGLSGYRRRRALIQLASTLRNLGHPEQSVALLTAERERQESDELDDALDAFLALALVDTGHAREAAGLALAALAKHLPRYNRSLAYYATHL